MCNKLLRYLLLATLISCTLFLVSSKTPSSLERIKIAGKLVVLSQNGPTTYYEAPDGTYTGFEYSLLHAFAEELKVTLEIRNLHDLDQLFNTLPSAHLAAAGLTVTPQRRDQVRFSPAYLEIRQQVIYRLGEPRPREITDLRNKTLAVIAGSAHAENLSQLAQRHPWLSWDELSNIDTMELLELVQQGIYHYAIVDSHSYDLYRGLYPNTHIAFDLSDPQPLAWAFAKNEDDSLYRAARNFMLRSNTNQLVAELHELHLGHASDMNSGGAQTFAKLSRTRLPKWRDQLKQAGDKYAIDWQLLAALSYQESHWNPRAKSPTGVRGLMMLTLPTARELGVNRLDPEESIDGGARYFAKVRDKLASRIREPDRSFMALAAYNVGYGHLQDARILTSKMGANPDRWADVRDHLPLLAKRKYYRQLKHGYARGWEPVIYVQNIRHYHALLTWSNRIEAQRLAANNADNDTLTSDQEAQIESDDTSSTL